MKKCYIAAILFMFCALWAQAEVLVPVSVTGSGLYHNDAGLIMDGVIPAEETDWDSSQNVWWKSTTSVYFTLDLGAAKQIVDVRASVDNNDDFEISYSSDNQTFSRLFLIPEDIGHINWYPSGGMETFSSVEDDVGDYFSVLDFSPVEARYIRIQALSGDNSYSIGELQIIGESLPPEYYSMVVNSGSGTGSYTNGQEISITADDPVTGYAFSHWTSTPAQYTNTISDMFSSTAEFVMPAANVALAANYVLADSDSDGMDDAWEQQYFGSLNQTPNGDYDKDGRTNGEEEDEGTDPTDAGSTLGLVAYYPFDGNANDESGNGNNGSVSGPTLVNDRFDVANKSYRFDGGNDVIRVPNSETINISGNITLCAWVKADSGGQQDPRILHKQNAYQLFGSPGRAAFYVSGPGNTILSAPAPGLIKDTWQLLVGVADGNYWRLYIDGVEVASILCAQGASQSSDLLSIGLNDWNSDQDDFCGSLDDIRIYNRALSSNEVARLYIETAIDPDTDSDGLDDSWEITYFGNLDQVADGDYDADGRTNGEEENDGTNPTNAGSTLGLEAYYSFDGNAEDESENERNGVVSNALLAADRNGLPQSAYSFNGSNSYISLGFHLENGYPFALSAWIKTDMTTGKGSILAVDEGVYVGNHTKFIYQILDGKLSADLREDSSSSGSRIEHTSAVSVADGTWHHVLSTFDGLSSKLYVNGKLSGEHTNYSFDTLQTSLDYVVGAKDDKHVLVNWFKGELDDIRLYSRVLASNEVARLYLETQPAPDLDGDGMDDAWEQQYFGNLDQTADGDYDGDGRTNVEEEDDGTDPKNAGSTLGLVAYYPFDGNAEDASGNGLNGTVVGATFNEGIRNSALSVYGSDDHVEIPHDDVFNLSSNATISVWVNLESWELSQGGWIIGKHKAYDNDDGWDLVADNGHFLFRFWNGAGYIRYPLDKPDEWVHIAIVKEYDSSSLSMFVDGTHVASTNMWGVLGIDDHPIWIGAHYNLNYRDIDGLVDDVRFYDRALSSSELQRLYAANALPPTYPPRESDEYTVLLDQFDGSTLGTSHGSVDYINSAPGLDEAVSLPSGAYVKYSQLTSWSGVSGGTVEMWIKLENYGMALVDFNNKDQTTVASSGYYLTLSVVADGRLRYDSYDGTSHTLYQENDIVPSNTWTHVGVTWGPDGTTLYVGGEQVAYTSENYYPGQTSLYTYLNRWGSAQLGCIDDFRISNVARTAAEMAEAVAPQNDPAFNLAVTSGSGDGSYVEGAQVQISADSPASGYEFSHWTCDPAEYIGNLADADIAVTTFAMPALNVTLTANYVLATYTVQFDLAGGSRSGGGALLQQIQHGAYAQQPIVTAPSGYSFVGWNASLGPITSGCTITALYEQTGSYWHTVNFSLGDHGSRSGGGELSQQVAHAHAAVAPEVTADEGWIHSGWSATFSTVLANLEIYAVYTRDPAYKQLTVVSAYGSPSPAAGVAMLSVGSEVICSTPEMVISNSTAIYTCSGWSTDAGGSGTGNTVTLTMNEDIALTWIWEVQYYLDVNASGPGSVDVSSGYYPEGSALTMTATPQAGYEFQGWNGAASGMNSVAEIAISGAKTVTATFGEHLVEAKILELSPARTLIDSAVTFRGSAEASGGATISQYRWRMIKLIDGIESGGFIDLSDQSVFIRDDLPEGHWRVYFDAQDSTGTWSAAQTAELRMENPAFLTDLSIARTDIRFLQEDGSELDPMMANQVRLGDRVSAEITVHNDGGVDATNSVIVSLFDGRGPTDLESHADDSGLLATSVLTAIPAGGSTQTLIEWHVGYDSDGNVIPDCDGTFRLIAALAEFEVNRDQAALNAGGADEELPIYEASLLNNNGQATVLIGEVALEDYTMSVTVPQVSVYEDRQVVVSGSARYEWLDDGAPNDDAVLGAVVQVMIDGRVLTTKTCSPDGRFSVNAGYMPVGDYDVQVQVDDGTLTATAQSQVHVNALVTPPPAKAELSVVAVDVAGPGMYETESTMPHTLLSSNVTFSATIRNSGNLTAVQPFTVRFFVNDDSNVIGTATVTSSLNPGASSFVVCPVTWSTNVVGTYSVYAEVDSDHQVDEKIESNNQRSLAVAVHEGLPDLRPYYVSGYVVNTISVSPAAPVQGEELALGVEVFNAGPVPMTEETFSVVFYANGTPVAATNVTTSLICGESVDVNLPWDTSEVQPGMFDLSVNVDVDDVVREDFENNNSARISFELLPVVPVLVLDKVESSRSWVYAGDSLTFSALVRNAGGADYESGSTLWLCEESLASTVSGVAVGPLGVGRTTWMNMSWQAPDDPGRVLLLFTLDGVVKTLYIDVYAVGNPPPPPPPCADPGLYSSDLSIPGEWTRGDHVSARAVIHNLGNLPSTNVLAQFYYSVDSVGYVPLGTAQLIDALSAGAATSLTSTATFEAMEPYYTVKVRLTPSGGNRLTSNDAATRSFAIEAPWADAGSDRITVVGHSVMLDGSASQYATAYSWEFSAMPAGSAAVLTEADTAQPSFIPDVLVYMKSDFRSVMESCTALMHGQL